MLSIADSVILPYKPGFEAVVRSDSTYRYLKNVSDVGKYVYEFPSGWESPTVGNFTYNEDGLFFYGKNWRNDQKRWQVYVRGVEQEYGVQRQIQGDCIGFDGKRLYVRNAVTVGMRQHQWSYGKVGQVSELYGYDLQPRGGEDQPECRIYAR